MTALRLKSVRNQARKMLMIDGVPLGCDGLFADPALVILAEGAARKFSHVEQRSDNAWLFPTDIADDVRKAVADEIAAYKAAEAKRNEGLHLSRDEVQDLRALLDYLKSGWQGPHAKTVEHLAKRVGR